jgi:steroid delta-isomerase-like uncharacterized protein
MSCDLELRKETPSMAGEENKALVHLFHEEFWNKGNLAAADELLTAGARIALPGMGQVGLDAFKAFAASLREAFPDWYSTTDELMAEGARVAVLWTGRGTQQGEFQGVTATGRPVTVPGFGFYRVSSGKITVFRCLFDEVLLLQQLGGPRS